MKKSILLFFGAFWAATALAQYSVRGGNGEPLLAEDDRQNRIQVYLLNGLADAEISFYTENNEAHQWFKYNMRYAEAVPVSCRQDGNRSTVAPIEEGWAYFVESPSQPTPTFIWVVDYSRYAAVIASLTVEEEEDRCEFLKLAVQMEAPSIYYRTYQGATVSLPRRFHLTYENLEWEPETSLFVPKTENISQQGPFAEISIPAPLRDTHFTLSGDDFAKHFNVAQSVTTAEYRAVGLDAHAKMTVATADETEPLEAGVKTTHSAPVEIHFEARANEPVAALYIWNILKMNRETGEETPVVRYTDREINYTFRESGQYTAVLEVVDARSVCSNRSQSFEITIEESYLQLPNAFSPGSSLGVNDEYRVSYKSIVRFRASIYNRWGNLLYHWEDPAKGWDGKVNGRYVSTGVYYIVVEATGSDGKTYQQSKDINILRSKNGN
jgi:gliding motility-associated-like protein